VVVCLNLARDNGRLRRLSTNPRSSSKATKCTRDDAKSANGDEQFCEVLG
jgi:hypothetical protein